MTLARRLQGAAWKPALPLVASGGWSLTGTSVRGRIRRGKLVDLDGWRGRVDLDGAGLALTDVATGRVVGRCRETRTRQQWPLTVGGQPFEAQARAGLHPLLVTDAHGAVALSLDLSRLRRHLTLQLAPHLDDATTVPLVALTSLMATRRLTGPQSHRAT
ncbi:MAG TPA: hypothetical protein VIL36_24745 [Acidimicrobiales bacterium]